MPCSILQEQRQNERDIQVMEKSAHEMKVKSITNRRAKTVHDLLIQGELVLYTVDEDDCG